MSIGFPRRVFFQTPTGFASREATIEDRYRRAMLRASLEATTPEHDREVMRDSLQNRTVFTYAPLSVETGGKVRGYMFAQYRSWG